jgi:hypothetical protein
LNEDSKVNFYKTESSRLSETPVKNDVQNDSYSEELSPLAEVDV